jgi:hypothetical protein
MGLWDVLTGKVWRWNQMKVEATRQVYKQLKPFVSSRLGNYPNSEQALINVRNSLLAFYTGAATFLSNELDGQLQPYKGRLFALNSQSYLYLIGAFHAAHAIKLYHDKQSEVVLHLMSEGIRDMYGRPDNYILDWQKCTVWFESEDQSSAATRVAIKLHDEITPILGLSHNDPAGWMFWSGIGLAFVQMMRLLNDNPEWPRIVEKELAAV